MEKNDFVFGKTNYILIVVAIALIITGFIMMSGGKSNDPAVFNPEIFSPQRIKIAPLTVMCGFGLMVYAILYKGKQANKPE